MNNSKLIENLLTMLSAEPKDVFLNYALGLEYAKDTSTLEKAEQQFKLVLEFDPNYIAAYYQLGQLFTTLNQINVAVSYYSIGLEKAKEQKNNKAVNEFGEAIFMLED